MRYFEDFQVGESSSTRSRTITETDITNFCMLSGDWYPLHSDAEYARNSIFGQRIAHGMLILSVATGLIPLTEMSIIAFYGMDSVRFVSPVCIGDTITVHLEVVDARQKEQGGVITQKCTIRNHRNETAVLADLHLLLENRD